MVLGLVGGVGSGKSTVTEILKKEYGFTILYTDDIAKKLELPGEPVYKELCRAFGNRILAGGMEGERIDKVKFAELIYGDSEALKKASDIIHPAVWRYVREYIDRARTLNDDFEANLNVRIAVETALPDADFKGLCDSIWHIFAKDEVRIERLIKSRGYSREKCLSIIKSQREREALYRDADVTVDNSFTADETKKQIEKLLDREIRSKA